MRGDAMISFYMSEQHYFSPLFSEHHREDRVPLTLFYPSRSRGKGLAIQKEQISPLLLLHPFQGDD